MNETFTGRVRLTSLQASKSFGNAIREDGTADSSRYVARPSVMVEFSAVKDGDEKDCMYGAYTPAGQIKLTIANEQVARELSEAWGEWIAKEEMPTDRAYYNGYADQPKYEVTFRRIL